MALYLENLGLDVLARTEEEYFGLVAHAAKNGKAVIGYSGNPYINQHYDWAQLILTTRINKENQKLEVVGVDTHGDGHSIWTVRINTVLSPAEGEEESVKRLLVSRSNDGKGLAVISVVNADILPSFLEDDVYDFQMIAFPKEISYFASEEEYHNSLKKDDLGRTFGLAEGSVFPSGFLNNHDPNNKEVEKNRWMDDYTLIRGTVKRLCNGVLELGGKGYNAYIRCIIDTEFGELEINHTYDQVEDTQKDNIEIGATVVMLGVLSADAAIREYTDGIIKDEEHHLQLLRHVFVTGEADRLRFMLAEDAQYVSENSNSTYHGVEEIIERLKYVHRQTKYTYYAHLTIISKVDDGEEELDYNKGKRCVVLASDKPENYQSIAFIEVNEQGLITRILTTAEERYHFATDRVTEEEECSETFEPAKQTYLSAIVIRAKYMYFVDHDVDSNVFDAPDEFYVRDCDNVRSMLKVWPAGTSKWDNQHMELLFGYLFAKAIEAKYSEICNEEANDYATKLIVSYQPKCAWSGRYDSQFEGKIHSRLEVAMKYGKQLYRDFKFYHTPAQDDFEEELVKALALVQRIGRYCAEDYLKRE